MGIAHRQEAVSAALAGQATIVIIVLTTIILLILVQHVCKRSSLITKVHSDLST